MSLPVAVRMVYFARIRSLIKEVSQHLEKNGERETAHSVVQVCIATTVEDMNIVA